MIRNESRQLNQQIVFDLLAILEDGFSRFRAVKSQSVDSESKTSDVGGSISASNLFSLLGVSLSGKLGKTLKTDQKQEYTEERVHTPTSLFSKLKAALQEQSFDTKIMTDMLDNFKGLSEGGIKYPI